MVLLRVVLRNQYEDFTQFLKDNDFGYTLVDGEGTRGKVKILFSTLPRKKLNHVLTALAQFNPNSFYTIESIKTAGEGIFPSKDGPVFAKLFRKHRKSK